MSDLDSDSESSGSLPDGDGALWASWSLVGAKSNIMASTVAVTCRSDSSEDCDTVEDAVNYLADDQRATCIYVYSGVHGDPWGGISLDQPDFLQSDVDALAEDSDDLNIQIKGITYESGSKSIPIQLWYDVNEPGAYVVLAWCFSKFYYEGKKAEFDSKVPPANSISAPQRLVLSNGRLVLPGGRFALPARKIGGRRHRRPG